MGKAERTTRGGLASYYPKKREKGIPALYPISPYYHRYTTPPGCFRAICELDNTLPAAPPLFSCPHDERGNTAQVSFGGLIMPFANFVPTENKSAEPDSLGARFEWVATHKGSAWHGGIRGGLGSMPVT